MTLQQDNPNFRFCTECGSPIASGHKFCGACGHSVVSSSSLTPPQQYLDIFPGDSGTISKRIKTNRWDFLAPATIGKKPFELFPEFGTGGLKKDDEGVVDFLITNSYFVASKSPPRSGVYKAATAIGINTMGLGVVGGVAALSVALLGEGYEKLMNGSKSDGASLLPNYQCGQILFIDRSEVTCHEILYKEGLLSPTVYEVAIAGKFHHVRHGQVDIAFMFWDSDMHKALESSGWTIEKTGIKYSKSLDASNSLAPRYLDMPRLYEQLRGAQ